MMKISHPKIVNVKYKNVIKGGCFAQNEMQITIKRNVDELCNDLKSPPTGFFLAVFGTDTNQQMQRAYEFSDDCPVGVWDAVNIIKNSV